jgi:S1-C subfamily serine protease
MTKPPVWIVLLLTLTLAPFAWADNAPIVHIMVTHQAYDPFLPWQKRSPGTRSGFGVVIDDSYILTTEGLVRNNTLIEIQLARSGENIAATVIRADPQVNLALIQIDNPGPLNHLNYPDFQEAVPIRSAVEIVQLDETRGIQRGEGQLVKALVDMLPNAPFSALQYSVLTDLNVDGEAAAVLYEGKLAGIMLSYSRASRTGKMLPASFIKRFIQDAKNGPYNGFASAGFSWQPLVDPTKRTYLGVDSTQGGVQVLACLPGTDAGKVLQANDVIITWDGHAVDNLGYYEDDHYGRLQFAHLLKGIRMPGDTVPVVIVRDGKQQEISLSLAHRDESHDLIPDNLTGAPCAYLIDGGFVIRELTGRMLKAYGAQWQTRVDPRLAHLYLTKQYSPEKQGDRIVLLSSVLPDPINIGYQHILNQIIEAVNQQPIRNLKDVFRIVQNDGHIKSLSLHSNGVDLVLGQDALDVANARISSQYRLHALQRDFR